MDWNYCRGAPKFISPPNSDSGLRRSHTCRTSIKQVVIGSKPGPEPFEGIDAPFAAFRKITIIVGNGRHSTHSPLHFRPASSLLIQSLISIGPANFFTQLHALVYLCKCEDCSLPPFANFS
ncbi:hypothetical protein L873DRAFT_1438312 [Choiromyces venosus 120613-1]|uniref:Uncharacterized protein n=1 Tax=Choiromyces venosus 120613-1 TaxID=1336337 RepID=A0A3N4JBJ2_9PEZI|nr:hypothetical protein L873DRAFT_1438312 [Choiromyces venosus 120613-1]